MCEANVYIDRNGQEKLFMEQANIIIFHKDGTLFIENIFGERKTIAARVKEMKLVEHKIILEESW
ncbi:CooT family nickel-binding protein [Thermotalea metallivorans]|uniref:RNA-binding protein n=1 Tax=Thermotalea metallivorans TaxID=520762 RepID=A0A140L157_9FIRM|nr:CooT family nickel-binding protein [Thermotalea metallivorans]KXG74282.1 hypothetical protein AN619_24740 [Thermotalea metallivorans]